MATFHASLAALLLPCIVQGQAPCLEELERSRNWNKVRVSYLRTSGDNPHSPRFFQATRAGHDSLLTDRGDADGVVARYADGTPQGYGHNPRFTLSRPDETWVYGAGQIVAMVYRDQPDRIQFDIRTLGALPTPSGAFRDAFASAAGDGCSVSHEDGLEVVRLQSQSGLKTWRLDPTRGSQPVRVTLESDGRIVAESRTSIDRFGNVWFPTRVEYFREGYRGGAEPFEIIEVESLEVEPADVPDRITPEYLGIDNGVNIQLHWILQQKVDGLFKWGNGQILSLDEYGEQYLAGRIKQGPLYTANCELADIALQIHQAHELKKQQNQGATSKPNHHFLESLTQWEAETLGFISHYRLDSEQAQRALTLLRECQEMGETSLARHAKEVNEWRGLAEEMSGAASAPEDLTRRAAARNAFMAPLEQITATCFRPRLLNLPTRAQRKAVGPPSPPH